MLKKLFFISLLALINAPITYSQRVGVGTNAPQQMLDINGKLKIGNDNVLPVAGAIRFNEVIKDFEGYTGTEWKSLTASFANSPNVSQGSAPLTQTGHEVVIFGDYAAVSAPRTNGSEGLVRILKKINGAWSVVQTIPGQAGSAFGFGLSIAMNQNYLVIGSPMFPLANYAGRISLYKLVNDQFVFLSNYQAPTPTSLECFGGSLCLYGNYLAVGGIPVNRTVTGTSNRVHLYTIQNDGLQHQQVISNPLSSAQEDFGSSIAMDSSVLAIGAPKADNLGNTDRGRVYMFRYAGANTFTYNNVIEYAAYGDSYDNFGSALSLSGNTLVIGAPGLDINPLFNLGSVFVCAKNGSGNFESTSLLIFTHPFDTPETYFGKSVIVKDRVILVGSNKAVYQYVKFGANWELYKILSNSLPGVAEIDAGSLALYGQSYGIGNPVYNSDMGRFVLGDYRY